MGTLTISGGTVKVSGDLVENDGLDGNGTSTVIIQSSGTLDMMPPGDTVPGNITVDTIRLALGSLVNFGTLSLTNLTLVSPATTFSLAADADECAGRRPEHELGGDRGFRNQQQHHPDHQSGQWLGVLSHGLSLRAGLVTGAAGVDLAALSHYLADSQAGRRAHVHGYR